MVQKVFILICAYFSPSKISPFGLQLSWINKKIKSEMKQFQMNAIKFPFPLLMMLPKPTSFNDNVQQLPSSLSSFRFA
jgi:hypothetical protein